MASLTLQGSTSGQITLATPAVAGTNTITLPAATGTLVTSESASISGNLTFTGTGNRILGDFSNATVANRVMFQSSTTNTATVVGVLPNGTSTNAQLRVYANSDPTNAATGAITAQASYITFQSTIEGSGTYLPMAFFTGGSERMRIDTSGNVGIGTSSPAVALDVYRNATSTYGSIRLWSGASASFAPRVILKNDIAGAVREYQIINGASAGNFDIYDATAAATRMSIDSSGNVGIGTTSPGQRLDLGGGSLTLYNSTGTQQVYLYRASATNYSSIGTDSSAGGITFTTGTSAPSERMRINSSGNVGIGTNNPAARLDLGSAISDYVCLIYNDSTFPYGFGIRSNQFMMYAANGAATTFGNMSASSGGTFTERMRIDSSGNLLVGTTSTIASAKSSFYQNNAGGSWAGFFQTQNGTGCIGTTNVSGTASYNAVGFYNNGTSFSACGTIAVSGTTTSYNTSSDYRLKENVQPMTTGLAKISALKPVTYDWISDKSAGEGFIAHELQAVIPQAVNGEKDAVDADGKIIPQGVDYSKIVVHLVAAIQEQQAQITSLKAELDALKGAQ